MGLFDNLTEQFNDITSVLRKINALEDAIASIENWRHQQADPNISANVMNIDTLVSDMKTMYENIKNVANRVEAIPKEFEEHLQNVVAPEISDKIKTSLTGYVDGMIDDAKTTITDWVIDFAGDPSLSLASQKEGTILGFLHTAQLKAEEAIAGARAIFEKLQGAATQLKTDADAVGGASTELLHSMETEMTAIKDQFLIFGNKILDSAKLVGKNMGYAGKELKEAYVQIKTPLDMVMVYAKRCKDDNIVFLPYNLWMTLWWGFLK